MNRQWIPRSLRRLVLVCYGLLFVLMGVEIGVLHHLSNRNQGLTIPDNKYRLVWIYSPSALFITISGCWFLTESNAKRLAPWRAMAKRPTSAAGSLLLDYISPLQIVTLYKSLKNRDFEVWLAVAVSFCLNLLIILSNGIFTVEQQTIRAINATFSLRTSLNTNFDTNATWGSGSGLSTAFAISKYGLQYPRGTSKDFVYQAVDTSRLLPGTSAELVVDAFRPEIVCESAKANWTFGINYPDTTMNGSPGFDLNLVTQDWTCQRQFYPVTIVPARETFVFRVFNNCSSKTDKAGIGTSAFAVFAGRTEILDWEVLKDWRKGPSSSGGNRFKTFPAKMRSAVAMGTVCSIHSHLQRAKLDLSRDSVQSVLLPGSIDDNTTNTLISQKLTAAIMQSLDRESVYLTGSAKSQTIPNSRKKSRSDRLFRSGVSIYANTSAPFFEIMGGIGPQKRVHEFLDQDFITNSARLTTKLISIQTASLFLFPEGNSEIEGTTSIKQDRLVVSRLSFGLTSSVLAVAAVLSFVLGAMSKPALHQNPNTIASIAAILARSPDIYTPLGRGIRSKKALKSAISSFTYYTTLSKNGADAGFSIKREQGGDSTPLLYGETTVSKAAFEWWHPFSASILCRCLLVLLPIASIVLVETLLRHSKQWHGLSGEPTNIYVRYLWDYVPVIAIFCLNTLFEDVGSYTRIIQPYVSMHQGPTSPSRSVTLDLVNRTTVSAVYCSVRLQLFGTAAAVLATLLGSILPIAASGLFIPRTIHQTRDIILQQSSSFDNFSSISGPNLTIEYLPTPGLILHNNLSYPRWTHGKYALPQLTVSGLGNSLQEYNSSRNASFSVNLPAVYGVANCSLAPSRDMDFKVTLFPQFNYDRVSLKIELRSSLECPRMTYDTEFATRHFVAKWLSVEKIAFNPDKMATAPRYSPGDARYHGKVALPSHCPLSVVIFGWARHMRLERTVDYSDIRIFRCSPYVAEEMVNVEFQLPDFNISATKPPRPLNGTRRFFSEAEIVNTGDFSYYLPSAVNTIKSPLVWNQIDNFFRTVFFGFTVIPVPGMTSNNNSTNELLLQRIEQVYSTVVAQVYSEKRRIMALPSDPAILHNSTLAFVSTRIHQDEISTRVIQGIIATMLVCAILSMLLTGGRKVLPMNPCNIATTAVYLANSSLLSEEVIPPGSELLSKRELAWRGVLEGGMYSLGWWSGSRERWYGSRERWYGIDLGKAEKEE
ncbi:hypothetical protein B0J11DRAFT_207980 [Dendryphion nanum]|uniref:Uncharacterized protein n=1 Tax=Dendryphion nanum TaxID=256645 RepID=A0A9P9D062_9PLEO|nr:hypothetical protein B0J11DRAFT_207980 [Dendryphion nanum]